MQRCDVVTRKSTGRLVLVVQSDFMSSLESRIVVPLEPVDETPKLTFLRLYPVLDIEGEPYRMVTHKIAAVSISTLGDVVCSVLEQHDLILAATDAALQGH